MQKDERSERDERHRRQSCEGSSERMRATSEFQMDLADRTKRFALEIIRVFSMLPKTTEAQVLGKGTSVGANYREAYRGRSKAEFVAKCGDCLREIDETRYWLELLVDASIVPPEKLQSLLERV
jgi:four helix bundle protein